MLVTVIGCSYLVFIGHHFYGSRIGLKLDVNDAEVGAAQIQRDVLALLLTGRQMCDVRDETFHVRATIRGLV